MSKQIKKTTVKKPAVKKLEEEEIEIETNAMSEAEMSAASGEDDIRQAPKYPLPSLKLNGKDGAFYRTFRDEEGNLEKGEDDRAKMENLGDKMSGVILKVRKTYFQDSTNYQLFSNEGGNNAVFTIFSKSETTKGFSTVAIFKGNAQMVKKQFPEIQMIQVIYFMLTTGEVVRLKVKGMSLGQLFSYWKEFEQGEHIYQFVTLLGAKKDKNKYGTFFVNTFSKGTKLGSASFSKVANKIKEVNDKVQEIEDYYIAHSQEIIDQDTASVKDPNYEKYNEEAGKKEEGEKVEIEASTEDMFGTNRGPTQEEDEAMFGK